LDENEIIRYLEREWEVTPEGQRAWEEGDERWGSASMLLSDFLNLGRLSGLEFLGLNMEHFGRRPEREGLLAAKSLKLMESRGRIREVR